MTWTGWSLNFGHHGEHQQRGQSRFWQREFSDRA